MEPFVRSMIISCARCCKRAVKSVHAARRARIHWGWPVLLFVVWTIGISTVLFKTMWGISLRIVLDDLFNNTLSARASSLSAAKFWPREAGVEAAPCPSLIPGLSRPQPKVVGCRERGTSCTQGNSSRTKCKMCHFQLETVKHAIK